jgi:hypothetical protein
LANDEAQLVRAGRSLIKQWHAAAAAAAAAASLALLAACRRRIVVFADPWRPRRRRAPIGSIRRRQEGSLGGAQSLTGRGETSSTMEGRRSWARREAEGEAAEAAAATASWFDNFGGDGRIESNRREFVEKKVRRWKVTSRRPVNQLFQNPRRRRPVGLDKQHLPLRRFKGSPRPDNFERSCCE